MIRSGIMVLSKLLPSEEATYSRSNGVDSQEELKNPYRRERKRKNSSNKHAK
jgi:hypothetical protein